MKATNPLPLELFKYALKFFLILLNIWNLAVF